MKASDLRAKDGAGLVKEVSELLKAHFGLRMQKATQQLTNHSQLKVVRRDIARAKTIQTEQRKAAALAAPPRAAKPAAAKVAKKKAAVKAPEAAAAAAPAATKKAAKPAAGAKK